MSRISYGLSLGLSAIFAIGAIATLLPWAGAPWPNMLGYRSFCSFAPGSTLACALLAALSCTIRARLSKRAKGPIAGPLVLIAILAGSVAWSTASWAGVKAEYADAGSSASKTAEAAR
jgi:hypothetical protein